MPANQFGRYVWLVDTLRHYKHLSYKEINDKWQKSGLSYGDGDDLPLRTFHNHRKAIQDIFNIIIELDPDVKGYKYHIMNPRELEGDHFRSWLGWKNPMTKSFPARRAAPSAARTPGAMSWPTRNPTPMIPSTAPIFT